MVGQHSGLLKMMCRYPGQFKTMCRHSGQFKMMCQQPGPIKFFFFFFFYFLAPHLGHIYLTIYCTFITLCADNMVELQLLLIHLICSGCQASPSLLICCICWQWPGPLLLLHHYLRLLPSFSVPAYNCCIRWWSSCPNLQLLVCCCLAAYSCTGAATLLLM